MSNAQDSQERSTELTEHEEKKRRGSGKAPSTQGKGIIKALEPLFLSSHSTARAGYEMTAATDTTIQSKIVWKQPRVSRARCRV